MECDQPEPTEVALLQRLAQCGWPRDEPLAMRWQFLLKRPATARIFHLLLERGEMYQEQILDALHVTEHWLQLGMSRLMEAGFVEVGYRQGPYSRRKFYQIRPGMAEQFQQWLDTQKSDKAQS